MLAPIILFVYNRLFHTKKTIEALKQNLLASESQLYIYSDGYKNDKDKETVIEVRNYLKTIKGFKKISIIEQTENKGLSKSIIHGITEIINKYEKAIILEDDIVTSPYFLNFMNDSLNFYQGIKKIWHISGWNYPIANENLQSTFLWRTMNCWGWATWKDRWEKYEKNPKKLINTFTKDDINRFNLDGATNFWEQVSKNKKNEMNTWAIFWYAIIFQNNGLCLNPSKSFVDNIGFDGSGTNTGYRDNYTNNLLIYDYKITFPKNLKEDRIATDRIKLFFREQNNPNLTFSKNLNKLITSIHELTQSNQNVILYGAGTGMHLFSNFFDGRIEFIIDVDEGKNNTYINEIKVISLNKLRKYNTKNLPIVITVFGREKEIEYKLINEFNISQDKIISLELI